MNSDTPRTDVAESEFDEEPCSWAVDSKFARKLERELNAAKAELEKLKAQPLGNWNNSLLDYDTYDPT